jgi:hypothetical protein
MEYDEMEDPNFDEHATTPSPVCDGDIGCPAPIEVIFLRTGAKMCAEHALDQCTFMVARDREDRSERDTDKAPPGGSPTLSPVDYGDDDSPAKLDEVN